MILITSDLGEVKVGDQVLPGVFESLEITGSVKMDEVEIAGKKEKLSQAVGYTNAKVRLNLKIIPKDEDDDCIETIAQLQRIFRSSPSLQVPGVYRIVNKHVLARGIDQVTFTDLRTYEDNRTSSFVVTAEFQEYNPVNVTISTSTESESGSSSDAAGGSSGSGGGSGDYSYEDNGPAVTEDGWVGAGVMIDPSVIENATPAQDSVHQYWPHLLPPEFYQWIGVLK